jgi:hypothetical protein
MRRIEVELLEEVQNGLLFMRKPIIRNNLWQEIFGIPCQIYWIHWVSWQAVGIELGNRSIMRMKPTEGEE